MLFIYNHDNEYDKDLFEIVDSLNFTNIETPENSMLAIFDSVQIRNLMNIVTDIKGLVADEKLPNLKDITYFYPDLIMSKRYGEEWSMSASLETLTAPWFIIKHKAIDNLAEGFLIYYQEEGSTIEEFIFLLDYLSHYQMLLSDKPIRIRLTNPNSKGVLNLNKAKQEYLKSWGLMRLVKSN